MEKDQRIQLIRLGKCLVDEGLMSHLIGWPVVSSKVVEVHQLGKSLRVKDHWIGIGFNVTDLLHDQKEEDENDHHPCCTLAKDLGDF